jgi:stress response protein YsnF
MAEREARENEVGARKVADDDRDARDEPSVVRHEEELEVGTQETELAARARKYVETHQVTEVVPRRIEHAGDVERVPPADQDSGEIETLPDGSVSIPILEEELVVTKRTIVRERLVIRKGVETERRRIETDLRKERVEIETDEGIEAIGES